MLSSCLKILFIHWDQSVLIVVPIRCCSNCANCLFCRFSGWSAGFLFRFYRNSFAKTAQSAHYSWPPPASHFSVIPTQKGIRIRAKFLGCDKWIVSRVFCNLKCLTSTTVSCKIIGSTTRPVSKNCTIHSLLCSKIFAN